MLRTSLPLVVTLWLVACANGNDPPAQGGEAGTGGAPASGGAGAGGQGTGAAGGGTGAGAQGGQGGQGTCGDGVNDDNEACDGPTGKVCADLGFQGGDVLCNPDCTIDLSECSDCNNGIVQTALGEQCDFDSQGDPLISASCASLGYPDSGANPGCNADCTYDIKVCLCGNGTLDAMEICDGALLGGHTCASEGFSGGTLGCTPDCTLDVSGCSGCGNGALDAGEQCDDGNTMSGDGCSATCQTESVGCDPDGAYTIIQGGPASYSCCSGLVSVNVTGFVLSQNGAVIGSTPANPVNMTGAATSCPAGSFSNTGSIAGGCTETYSLQGSFVGPDTWSGTYQVMFTGPDCDCFGGALGTPCVNQLFPITAQR